ncbi:hypothetical protein [Stenotrophomonas sp. MMGLT7]|uniref:hypothetical protein n=1 Tax=Stenotrophomonas sp. MMGLT7 TaxID=2901227 RepID=UPI001E61229B|nr:hypothetical protein [Stenotrophomonas sp. MMGLT7]MCD7099399.1 hypothetical protein [Stenotrophomonas sp. MMGLT7]
MHLAKADDYEGQERQRPSYWETADNKYRVASRAVDANPYDREGRRKGIRVRRGRGSRTQCIGWLPPGTAIVVEGGNGAWRKISSFEEGSMVADPDNAPAQDAPKGWIYIGELDIVTISHPAAIDMVHIPEVPVTLKAGDFVGYLGQYKRRRDAGPFCSSRPIVHLEVFTGDDLDAFIAKSRLRAAELPDSSLTMLLIEEGAQLAMPSEPDQTIAATEAVMVEGAAADVTWVQVRRGNVQILPRIGLGNYSGDATRVYGGRYHLLRIMDNAGKSIELEQFNALSSEAKTGYPNREVFLAGDERLWVERDVLGGRHVVSGHELKAWSRFPMQTSDTSGPRVSVPRVLTVVELGKPETEADGPRWWQVEVGTEKGSSASGWACEKGQAKVRLCSPWDWPGFDVTREGTPTKDMHEYSLDVNGEVQPDENFKATADQVDGSTLFRKLRNIMDLDGKDGVSRDELRAALRRPWLAQAISHLIVHYESEWGGEMSKWSALDPHMQGELAPDWVAEKQRIEKLRWWQHVAGKHDFPSDPNVFHIHPIALVTNFHGQVVSGCYCHRDMTEDEIREIVLAMRKSEGAVYDRVGDRLFTENNVSLPEADRTYARLTDELNAAFDAYGIDTCIRRLHFLAQAYWESDRFRTTKEYGSGHRYAPYDGRGLMQLTWRRAYEMYESQTGTSCVQTPDNISNSLHHSVDSAAWYWRQGKELSAGDRWSAPSSAPDYVRRHNPAYPKTTHSYVYDGESRRYGTVDLSLIADDDYVDVISWLVNGGSNGLAERRVYVRRLKEIMKYDQCANKKGS